MATRPPSIAQSVEAIVEHLRRLRRPSGKLIQPGLSPGEIAKRSTKLPFRLRPELVALYECTNGTSSTSKSNLGDL
jgi:hypothetical protein